PTCEAGLQEAGAGQDSRWHSLDRGQRDSAGRRRIRERGGAAAQPGARQDKRGALQADRRERGAAVAVFVARRFAGDQAGGGQAVRPRVPGSVRVRQRREVMRDKQANRRIRLLLVIFALIFAATLARAVWLQGVRAATLGRMAERQHRETAVIPAGRGTSFDTNGVQL